MRRAIPEKLPLACAVVLWVTASGIPAEPPAPDPARTLAALRQQFTQSKPLSDEWFAAADRILELGDAGRKVLLTPVTVKMRGLVRQYRQGFFLRAKRMVAGQLAAARKKQAEAAGIVQTAESSLAIVSSAGVAVASSSTHAEANTVVTRGDGSGYAEGLGTCLSALNGRRIGQQAALKASISRNPQPLEAGRYDVVLEPAAVGEWLQYLAYVALSGKDFDEGSSPLSGRLGEKVTGAQVTIWDNALDPRTLPQPFDYEGMPKKRLSLIRRGVAEAVGTNHYRARHLKKRISTGSALPASSSAECLPLHLFMKGGQSSARQLVGEMKRGLLITRFHYTNILDPMKTVLTGMTRDGTFLVEDGRIVHPVRNLRYTENVLEALGRIDGMSRKLTLVPGPCVVPTVRIKGVQFTGTTEF